MMPVLINQAHRAVSGPALCGGSRYPCMAIPKLPYSLLPAPTPKSIVFPSPVAPQPRARKLWPCGWRASGTHHGSARATLEVTYKDRGSPPMSTQPTPLPGPMAGPGFGQPGAMTKAVDGSWCHAWGHAVGLES